MATEPQPRDLRSFEVFYEREYRPVLGLAFVLSGDAGVAEELTQDAFISVLRAWDRVESPEAWVRRAVSNRAVSRMRRLGVEARALAVLRRRTGTQLVFPSVSDPAIWAAVRSLPRRQQQVIALTYVEDLSRREVARILGLTEETVKTHLERGRRGLAQLIVQEDA